MEIGDSEGRPKQIGVPCSGDHAPTVGRVDTAFPPGSRPQLLPTVFILFRD